MRDGCVCAGSKGASLPGLRSQRDDSWDAQDKNARLPILSFYQSTGVTFCGARCISKAWLSVCTRHTVGKTLAMAVFTFDIVLN